MSELQDRRLLLACMETAQAEAQRHLGVIERQIAPRAERVTITDRAKRRQHGRSASSWTNADKRLFQQHVAELALAKEIDALTRKLDRQETAIAEFRTHHRSFRCVAERDKGSTNWSASGRANTLCRGGESSGIGPTSHGFGGG